MSSFTDLALLLAVVAVGGLVAERLKVPLLAVYLATGIILGPAVVGALSPHEGLSSLGGLGVSLLLFSIALKLDLRTFRLLGWRALGAAVGQITVTAVVAAAIAYGLGFRGPLLPLVTCVLVMSSTVLVVKIFAEKKELESLHGQLAIAILILQDIAIVFVLVWMGGLGAHTAGAGTPSQVIQLLLGALVLVGGYLLGARGILRLMRHTVRHIELQLIVVLALAACYALAASVLGFSREVGAFIAGLAVAASPYKESVNTRLTPLRDFLLLFFFLDLGTKIPLAGMGKVAALAAALTAFALVVKPVIVLLLLVALRYSIRTAFLVALSLGTISEFSFLLAAAAIQVGVAKDDFLSLVAVVGLGTFFVAPLLLEHGEALYRWSSPMLLRLLGWREAREEMASTATSASYDVVCFGLGRYGRQLVHHLHERGKRVLGVDFDPEALRRARRLGIDHVYGDIEDEELYARLPLHASKWVVGTIRRGDVNRALLRGLKGQAYGGHVALAADDEEHASELEKLGAHVVLCPYKDGAELAAEAITDAADLRLHLGGWPVAFREIRVRSEASVVGKTIAELSLRKLTGATIIALSRGGRVLFDPFPATQIFPNDRVLLMGRGDELERAEVVFELRQGPDEAADTHFDIGRFRVAESARFIGQSLAEIEFRQRFGVTVVGIERDDQRLALPAPTEIICPGDVLVVIGLAQKVRALEEVAEMERVP
ncbi:MAG: cation:proton antiporter [Candidatus Sumerlaeaceae bacterium]|nr:cation:proton antiporter [Candidatus Sumerlaeaceae bacterium]